ncbi:MAG: hypothetical protein U5K54_03940 [Cytophagales bacterium]|nr:hypothetical protein [Cytophagales bacterium]
MPGVDFKMLLGAIGLFNYCRFVIAENYLQARGGNSDWILSMEDTVKEMLQEVANLADQYELKLTDSDIH